MPCSAHDRVVDRHELGAVREGPFDLNFVDELRHAVHHVGAPEQLPPDVHQLGDRAAVADELEDLRGDERDRLGMIQPHAPRQPLLRQHAGLMQRELVEFLRGQMHSAHQFRPAEAGRYVAFGPPGTSRTPRTCGPLEPLVSMPPRIVSEQRGDDREVLPQRRADLFDRQPRHAQQHAVVSERRRGDQQVGPARHGRGAERSRQLRRRRAERRTRHDGRGQAVEAIHAVRERAVAGRQRKAVVQDQPIALPDRVWLR